MEASKIRIGDTLHHKGEIITVLGISPHCGDYAINCEKVQKRKIISLDGTETIVEEMRPTWVYLKNCNNMENKEQNTGMSLESDKCIAFAEWILKEGFEKYEDNGKCWWGKFSDDKDYSTIQLFEMWSNSDASQSINIGWVSVEERLPEGVTSFKTMSDYVQVYCGLGGASYLGTGRYCHDRNKWYATSFNGHECGEWVSHYMPLPSPPKQ